MRRYFSVFALFLMLFALPLAAQEQDAKINDTIPVHLPEKLPATLGTQTIGQPQMNEAAANARFRPQLHPELPVQHRPLTFPSLGGNTSTEVRLPANVRLGGYGHDLYDNAERTAVFSLNASPRLTLYSAGTLGVQKSLLHPNVSYYNIDMGGAFALSPAVDGNAGVFYGSALQMPFSMSGAYLNLNYRATDRLQLDGGVSYRNLNLQPRQHSVVLNVHGRYQIADNWYMNVYGGTPVLQRGASENGMMHPMMPRPYFGGTLEYWFNDNFGMEGGMVWEQDMFGKLRPKPKVELLFDRKRRR